MNWYTQIQANQMLKEAQSSPEWSKVISTYGVRAILMLASLWGLSPMAMQDAYAKQPQKVVQELQKVKNSPQKQNVNKKTPSKNVNKTTIRPSADEKKKTETAPIDESKSNSTKQDNSGIDNQKSQDFSFEDIKNMIERHEGRKNTIYKIRGIWHIGIGCNLQREFMPQRLESIGVTMKELMKGKKLSDWQVNKLFELDLKDAKNDVRKLVPSFDSQPSSVQAILLNMAFNMGAKKISDKQREKGVKPSGLESFSTFLKAIENKNYDVAANSMMNSTWKKQVPNRANELIDLMQKVK